MKLENAIKELKDTWGYTVEELNHIREVMEEFGSDCYLQGIRDSEEEIPSFVYGKKEDY